MGTRTIRHGLAVTAAALAGLALPAVASADLLGAVTGTLGGLTGTTKTATTPSTGNPVTGVLAPVTNLLTTTTSGGSATQGVVGAVNSVLGGSTTPPAPTTSALTTTLASAGAAAQSGNPAAIQSSLAGVLSQLVGANANILDPAAVTGALQTAAHDLAAGDKAGAVATLGNVVGQLVGLTGVPLPAGVLDNVSHAVDNLLAGNPSGALAALGGAVQSALTAVPAAAPGDAVATLPVASTSAVGPVFNGASGSSPSGLYYLIAQSARAGRGRLVVLGARLVSHHHKVRVKVRCVGKHGERCAGRVSIRRGAKVLGHSKRLHLKVGQTRKVLVSVKAK